MRRPRLLVVLALVLGACRGTPQEAPAPAEAPPAPKAEPAPEPAPEPEPAFAQAGDLFYLEDVIGDASPEDPLPMIVAIHGLGDDPRNFRGLLEGVEGPARLILPRAIDEWEGGDGWSWFPVRARDGDPEGLSRGIENAANVVAAGIAELEKSRPTVGKPIVTGFSQGGMLTFELAVHHGELFAAAFPVGGHLPPPLWPEKVDDPSAYPPIIALHGDADPAVELGPTQAAVDQLRGLGLDADIHVYPEVGHAIPPPMRAELHQLLRDARAELTEE